MNENTNYNEKYGEAKIKSPFTEKIENFFYHYKWHTLIALFLVFTVTVCSVQMCQKTSYDAYVLYAGGTYVSQTAAEGQGESDYQLLLSSVKRFVGDFDEDGARNLSLLNLYIPSEEQLAEKENVEYFYSMISENEDNLQNQLYFGDYYICIMSKRLFDEYAENSDANPFAKIAPYLPEGKTDEYRLASDCGVYLDSTPLADNPGFSHLSGEETVLAIRKYSSFGKRGSDKKARERYAFAESTFRLMLEDKAY